jgi:hypothetical protein
VFALAIAAASGPSIALGDRNNSTIRTRLDGYHELLLAPDGAAAAGAINTPGWAQITTRIHDESSIDFRFQFRDLTTNLTAAHYHFAQEHTPGGIMVFLCGGGGQPACPAATSGVVSGTITAANVVGPANQGIEPGDLRAVIAAIRHGAAYANLHTVKYPTGEIRGQLNSEDRRSTDE